MIRCTKCILPDNYPGITFNNQGVCNHCLDFKKVKYLGSEALKKEVYSNLKKYKNRNKNFDCVLGFSGGRDSTYLLYYLVKILNLRVLAYSCSNGFIPEQTVQNMKQITGSLDVELVIEKHDYLEKCIKHHLLTWMEKPSVEMIGLMCTGCEFGVYKNMLQFLNKNNIPIYFSGGTPFEGRGFKKNILRINPNNKRSSSLILGFVSQVMRNPKWILNFNCLTIQINEYKFIYSPNSIINKQYPIRMSPYYLYIKWDEKKIINTIENELNWKKNLLTGSTWRGDCEIALLKDYLYKETMGFNDKDDNLSCLIRDGQINREEALERIKKEGVVKEEVVMEIFNKLGLDYKDIKNALEKISFNF